MCIRDSFYIPQHRDIYSVIVTLDALGSKIDPLIVLEELKDVYKRQLMHNRKK